MTHHADLGTALDSLIARYSAEFAIGSIIRCFARSVRDLRAAGVSHGLAAAAESMTDSRLRRRRSEQPALVSA